VHRNTPAALEPALRCGKINAVSALTEGNDRHGDGWQWQDEPRYPADAAHHAVELGVNFAIYALTH